MRRSKKYLSLLVGLILLLTQGCTAASSEGNLPDNEGLQKSAQDHEQKLYGLILKSQGNPYNDLVERGFKEVIEENGDICIVGNPEVATAQEQISLIESMIAQRVDAIAIAANDKDALQAVLQEAMNQGIKVSTLDSDTNGDSRMVFVNPVDTRGIGEALMNAVYDISEGEGQWAILSATNQAANQNGWIYAMQEIMVNEKYENLQLVDVVYGNDEKLKSKEKTEELIREYPNLKVICAPTVMGLQAAAETITEMGLQNRIKLTGLGLPSDMALYIGDSDDFVCPYMYLWDPKQVGQVSAYLSISMVDGNIQGKQDEEFEAGSLGSYVVTKNEEGAPEVIVAPPLEINPENISRWKNMF